MNRTRQAKWDAANCDRKREYARDVHHRRRDAISKIKLESGCVDCGYNEHPAALKFDHVRGKKAFAVGVGCTYAWDRVEKEMAKCEIRCANCHAIATETRRKIS